MKRKSSRRGRLAVTALAVAALALPLAACGNDGSPGASGGGTQGIDAALKKGGEITVWAWEPTLKPVVANFEKKYPNVKVKLENVGSSKDQYVALQNAIAAGSGIPDVAQIEYYAVPQFAISKALTNLGPLGADKLSDTFSPGPWNSVKNGDGVYGLPMDSGPMALFYNETIFSKLGVAVPKTWDEYLTAARTIHEKDPNAYIANDVGDAGFVTSMIWQAGGHPYSVKGTDVKINFTNDAGTKKFAEVWQKLIDEHLLAPIASWSDEWYQGLANGTIATLAMGAWMPANFESGVPQGSGQWRVAELPQWEAGQHVSAENGGSALTVPAASKNAELAYAFVNYATTGAGVQTRIDGGAFPATTAELKSDKFRDASSEYFGGQKINQILSDSAENVVGGWQYLPFQVYSNSIFNDTVGKAYVSGTTLMDGLAAWQKQTATYGNEQGFTVK